MTEADACANPVIQGCHLVDIALDDWYDQE